MDKSYGKALCARTVRCPIQTLPCAQVHGRKAVVNFRLYADDVVREPKQARGASCSSADTSGPSHLGAHLRAPHLTFSKLPGLLWLLGAWSFCFVGYLMFGPHMLIVDASMGRCACYSAKAIFRWTPIRKNRTTVLVIRI